MNPFPTEYENRIVCGNSLDVLRAWPDECVDLIFTSPPYNFGMGYDKYDDTLDYDRYFDTLNPIFSECIRVLKQGGRIVVNVMPVWSDYVPTHHIISDFFRRNGLIWRNEILWEKNNYNCKYTAWGSWKSPGSPYLKYTWEFVEVFCKGSLKHVGETKETDLTADEFKTWTTAKWTIAPSHNTHGHPATFPEELARRVIKLFSFKQDVVVDPFGGVGTTAIVANMLGRRYTSIDISERYTKAAVNRMGILPDSFL